MVWAVEKLPNDFLVGAAKVLEVRLYHTSIKLWLSWSQTDLTTVMADLWHVSTRRYMYFWPWPDFTSIPLRTWTWPLASLLTTTIYMFGSTQQALDGCSRPNWGTSIKHPSSRRRIMVFDVILVQPLETRSVSSASAEDTTPRSRSYQNATTQICSQLPLSSFWTALKCELP